MQAIQPIDLKTLPPQAQIELYDFYLFLQQRYALQNVQTKQKSEKNTALKNFLSHNKKRNIKVAAEIDLTALADEVNDMEI
ncbi:MAG: hypothetical protein RL637_1353 [Pseudomonadota bacterium]|jgi:hypothetical protein